MFMLQNFKVIGLLNKEFLSLILLYYFMPKIAHIRLLFQNLAFDNNMLDLNEINFNAFI